MKFTAAIFFIISSLYSYCQKQIDYYGDGTIKSVEIYKDGKRTGEWKEYYRNGQLRHVYHFENDSAHGDFKEYYENGQLSSIGKYQRGKRIGHWKFYHPNGELSSIFSYSNGKVNGPLKSFYDNGQLYQDWNMLNDLRHGVCLTYYKNGIIKKEENLRDDTLHGYYRTYFDNGQLRKKGHYDHFKKDSTWITYKENGELMQIANYENGAISGTWTKIIDSDSLTYQFNEEGYLEEKCRYNQGKRISKDEVMFDPDETLLIRYKFGHWNKEELYHYRGFPTSIEYYVLTDSICNYKAFDYLRDFGEPKGCSGTLLRRDKTIFFTVHDSTRGSKHLVFWSERHFSPDAFWGKRTVSYFDGSQSYELAEITYDDKLVLKRKKKKINAIIKEFKKVHEQALTCCKWRLYKVFYEFFD